MPVHEETTCPFCGARFHSGASACPACDLPLLGADGQHPVERRRAPFDGASLFDEAFPEDDFMPQRSFEPPLATERREGSDEMRCLVVAMNQAEADMLESVLRAEGVPCLVRQLGPQPYSMTSSRCEVLVPEFALPHARELLRIDDAPVIAEGPRPLVLAGAIVAGLIFLAAAVALIVEFV
jgi:hypothetical protein